jgi:hypothetical protein
MYILLLHKKNCFWNLNLCDGSFLLYCAEKKYNVLRTTNPKNTSSPSSSPSRLLPAAAHCLSQEELTAEIDDLKASFRWHPPAMCASTLFVWNQEMN